MDLTYEIFKEMSQWGSAPNESFFHDIRAKFSSHHQQDLSVAINEATELQKLVLGSSKFYETGFGEVEGGVKGYIKAGLPSVTPECLSLASRRIMFMYIK